jgi:hypothetical protein
LLPILPCKFARGAGMTKVDKKHARSGNKMLHEFKQGELTSSAAGKLVKSRRQALAIALSEAREAGIRLPPRRRDGV